MKKLFLLLVGIMVTSCTAEPIVQAEVINKPPVKVNKDNIFTVIWSSNQGGAYVEFNKHIFEDCEVISTTTELHRENKFDIVLKDNQLFDIHMKRTETAKNPELYLSIYKGEELQYEQETDSNGFVLISYVDDNGNISKIK